MFIQKLGLEVSRIRLTDCDLQGFSFLHAPSQTFVLILLSSLTLICGAGAGGSSHLEITALTHVIFLSGE